jgi:hypothetical protein
LNFLKDFCVFFVPLPSSESSPWYYTVPDGNPPRV